MGLRKGMRSDEGWAEIGVWASDTPEGERRRAATEVAVAHNAEDYSQLNIEAGFCYEVGALVADGTPPPLGYDSPTEFTPSARPGHHVPHVWLSAADGSQVSSSDLVAPEGLTLFVDASDAHDWAEAASAAASTTGCPIPLIVIGTTSLADHTASWRPICGVGASGAVLVRPDRHVAWRTAVAPADRLTSLTQAVSQVMNDRPTLPRDDSPAALRAITEAGEALRIARSSEPRLFGVIDA
jgi:2,4-dichlorophenol 6-monooxygenase